MTRLRNADDFKYLEVRKDKTKNDVKVRKALVWKSCNKLSQKWRLKLESSLKIEIFMALVGDV